VLRGLDARTAATGVTVRIDGVSASFQRSVQQLHHISHHRTECSAPATTHTHTTHHRFDEPPRPRRHPCAPDRCMAAAPPAPPSSSSKEGEKQINKTLATLLRQVRCVGGCGGASSSRTLHAHPRRCVRTQPQAQPRCAVPACTHTHTHTITQLYELEAIVGDYTTQPNSQELLVTRL
jgi:hypothetical protein